MGDGAASRAQMVSAARALFYAEGFNSTGIDRVAQVVGVSKRTLYKHFRSKDELFVECVTASDQALRRRLFGVAESSSDDPRGQITALFAALCELLDRPDYRGCPFINAAAEVPDPAAPVRLAASRHKVYGRRWIRDRAEAAGLTDPDALSWQIMALMDGAISQRLVHGPDAPTEPIGAAIAGLLVGRGGQGHVGNPG